VTLTDVCTTTTITKPTSTTSDYTIATPAQTIDFGSLSQQFSIADPRCTTTLTFSTSDGTSAFDAKLNLDASAQTLTIDIQDNLDLLDSTSQATKDYTVTMIYKVFKPGDSVTAVQTDNSVTVVYTIKNPCLDDTVTTVSSTPQTASISDNYSGTN